jgi:large subunit ribosomal protein L5
MARLWDHYKKTIRPKLMQRLSIVNPNAAPRILKITVSMGLGKGRENKKVFENAQQILSKVTGQKAVITKARTSVAQFKLRAGMPVGAMVTLRGPRAHEFLDRLIQVVIPRIRDFRGLPRTMDGRGNYNLGIAEQSVFPEIDTDLLDPVQGMNVSITISGGSDAGSVALLEELNFPFRPEAEAPAHGRTREKEARVG